MPFINSTILFILFPIYSGEGIDGEPLFHISFIPINKKTMQVTHHEITSRITCRKIKANRYQLEVVCASRQNLLGLIVKEINSLELSVHNAKINTLGQRAEDFFIISSKIKLNLESRIQTLIKNIRLKVDE